MTASPCGLSIFNINKYRNKLDYLTGTDRNQVRMQCMDELIGAKTMRETTSPQYRCHINRKISEVEIYDRKLILANKIRI